MKRASTAWLFAPLIVLASGGPLALPSLAQTSPPSGPQQPVPGGPKYPLPDLTIKGGYKPHPQCVNGKWLVIVVVEITNEGPGAAVLPGDFNRPMITIYPSKPLSGFVQPYQSFGTKVVLKPGETFSTGISGLFGATSDGGAYDVLVKVDPYNLIKETKETNNVAVVATPPGGC